MIKKQKKFNMRTFNAIQKFKAKRSYSDKIIEETGDLIVDGVLTSRAKLLEMANMIDAIWIHDIKPRDITLDQDRQYGASNTISPNPGKIKENPYDPDSFQYENHFNMNQHRCSIENNEVYYLGMY